MFEVEVTVPFQFTHYLEGFGDEYSTPHEHIWDVTVTVVTQSLDERGISIDFIELREKIAGFLKPYQGKLLNDFEPFTKHPPTAENIARWVAGLLEKSYPDRLSAVTVGSAGEKARYLLS